MSDDELESIILELAEQEVVEPPNARAKEVHYVDLDFSCVLARIQHDQAHEDEPCLIVFFDGEPPRHRHHVKHREDARIPATWHEKH